METGEKPLNEVESEKTVRKHEKRDSLLGTSILIAVMIMAGAWIYTVRLKNPMAINQKQNVKSSGQEAGGG